MYKKIIKYLSLLIPGLLALYILLPIGDCSSGIAHGLGFVFFELIFILIFIVIIIIQIVKAKNIKFDYIPIGIFFIQSLLLYLSFTSKDRKFWTVPVITAKIDDKNIHRSSSLTLYKNNSFNAKHRFVDFSHSYQGSYTISNDTLYLEREDLPQITEGLFTTIYLINQKDKTITPIDRNFLNLRIE